MSFDKLVEEKIRAAVESGEFDNLAGKGKPIDLTAYFATPEDLRLAYSVLKNAGVIPPEADLRKEINELKAEFERSTKEAEQRRLKKEIEDRTLKYNLLVESYNRKGRRG
jgi:hypothetical protein